MADTPIAAPTTQPIFRPFYFWQDVCTPEKKASFTHGFALFVFILTVISVVGVFVGAIKKKVHVATIPLSLAGAVVMYYNYRKCREWWEILLLNLLHAVLLGVLRK